MTTEEMKAWIDGASYQSLLAKWRNAPVGSPWFRGEIGDYYAVTIKAKRAAVGDTEAVAASKEIGW